MATLRVHYDFHMHSCLSPCGDDNMLPSNIVGFAALNGLDVIALTDHNTCRNCPAAMKLGEAYGVTVIPGMELTTAEEVHVVCLFPALDNAMAFDRYVYERLPAIPNRPDIFGPQEIVDADDNITGTEEKLLINATTVGFDQVFDVVASFQGVMMPAHIDKSANSLLSNLGFIPPDSRFPCAEVRHIGKINELEEKHSYLKQCRIFFDSDAHSPENIHSREHGCILPVEIADRTNMDTGAGNRILPLPEEVLAALSRPLYADQNRRFFP